MTHGLSQLEFSYEEGGAVERVKEVAKAWKQTHRIAQPLGTRLEGLLRNILPGTINVGIYKSVYGPYGAEDIRAKE